MATAPAVSDEDVWRLLLGQLWTQPDEQLLCRLLCTSAGMARLVHELCVGKAAVKLRRRPAESAVVWEAYSGYIQPEHVGEQVAAAGAVYRRWLAKHARLLSQLQLNIWDEQQQDVAAGLCERAGTDAPQPSNIVQEARTSDTPMWHTASAPAATAAASKAQLQAAATASGLAVQGASLPTSPLALASLQLYTTSTGGAPVGCPLLHALGACCRVTQLWLHVPNVPKSQAGLLQSSIASLEDLQELSVIMFNTALFSSYEITAADLRCGTQLTRLQLQGVDIAGAALLQLAPSLRALEQLYGGSFGHAAHLTALTHLHCVNVVPESRLPPSLQWLEVGQVLDVQPLLGLIHLQHLKIGYLSSGQQLQQVAAALGTSLTSVALHVVEQDVAEVLLSKRFDGTLPLTELRFHILHEPIGPVVHLGQWRGLHILVLGGSCTVQDTPQQLAAQLQQLTCLTHLTLTANIGDSHDGSIMHPVVDCIVGLSSLKRLLTYGPQLTAEQGKTLQAMTHVTELGPLRIVTTRLA